MAIANLLSGPAWKPVRRNANGKTHGRGILDGGIRAACDCTPGARWGTPASTGHVRRARQRCSSAHRARRGRRRDRCATGRTVAGAPAARGRVREASRCSRFATHHGEHRPRRAARHPDDLGAPGRGPRCGSPRHRARCEGRPVFVVPASGGEAGDDVPALRQHAARFAGALVEQPPAQSSQNDATASCSPSSEHTWPGTRSRRNSTMGMPALRTSTLIRRARSTCSLAVDRNQHTAVGSP